MRILCLSHYSYFLLASQCGQPDFILIFDITTIEYILTTTSTPTYAPILTHIHYSAVFDSLFRQSTPRFHNGRLRRGSTGAGASRSEQ